MADSLSRLRIRIQRTRLAHVFDDNLF